MADSLRLDDGFSTILHFAENPTVSFYEREVTPPGMDGGGATDVTTMRNNRLRTRSPKKLKTLTPMTLTVLYKSDVFDPDEVWAMINVNQQITLEMPDNSMLQFYGWLDKFIPGPNQEGNVCMATITIEPSNHNNDSPPLEVDPQYTPPVAVVDPEPFYDYDAPPEADPAAGDQEA